MADRRRRLAGLLVGLAVLAVAADAHAGRTRVGVVVATRVNLSEVDADVLASRLGDALRRQLEVEVVAGADARRRLPAEGVADDCVARPDCVRDLALRLDGDELLFLFMVRIGPRLQIDVTWSDPDIGALASRSPLILPAAGGDEADRVLAAAPSALLPHASPRQAPRASTEPIVYSTPTSTRVETGRHLTGPAVVSGVVAVAALATGAGFAIAARQDFKELEEDGCDMNECRGVGRRIDRMENRALAADILFAGAGAAAVTSMVLYFTSGGESESRLEVGAAPNASGGALVSLGGVF